MSGRIVPHTSGRPARGQRQQPSRGSGPRRHRLAPQALDEDVASRPGKSVFEQMFGPLYFRPSLEPGDADNDTAPTTDFDDDSVSMEDAGAAPGGGFLGGAAAAGTTMRVSAAEAGGARASGSARFSDSTTGSNRHSTSSQLVATSPGSGGARRRQEIQTLRDEHLTSLRRSEYQALLDAKAQTNATGVRGSKVLGKHQLPDDGGEESRLKPRRPGDARTSTGTTSAESRASDHRRNRTGTTESVSSSQPVAAVGAAADPVEDASSRPRGGVALKKKPPDQLVRHYTDLFSGVDGAERGTVHFERADEKIADQLYEPGPPVRYIDGERYVYLKAKPPGSQVTDKDGNEVGGGREDQEDGGTTSATSDGAGSYEPPSYVPPSPDITSKDKDVMASWEQRLHSMDKRHKEKDAADQLRQLDNLRRLAELEKGGGGSSAGRRGAGKKNAAALALAAENAEMMRAPASPPAAKPEPKNPNQNASENKIPSYEERIRSMEGRQLAREEQEAAQQEYDAQRLTDLAEAVRQHEAQQPESFEQKLQMQSMKQANKRGARVPTMIPTKTFSFGSLDSNGNVRRSPPTAPRFFEEQHLPVKPRDPSVVGGFGAATAPGLGESATAADGGAVVVAKDRNIVVPRDPSAMVRPSIDDWHPKLSATTAGTSPASGRREVWHSVPVIPTERPPTAGDGGSGSGETAEVESPSASGVYHGLGSTLIASQQAKPDGDTSAERMYNTPSLKDWTHTGFSDMKTVNPNVKNSSTSAWTSTTAATNVGSPKQEGPRGKEHRVEAATNSYLGGSRCRVGSTSKNKGGALAEDDTILVDQLGSPVEEQAPDEDVTRGDKHKNAVDLYGNIPPANFSLEWPDTRASFGGDNTGVDGWPQSRKDPNRKSTRYSPACCGLCAPPPGS